MHVDRLPPPLLDGRGGGIKFPSYPGPQCKIPISEINWPITANWMEWEFFPYFSEHLNSEHVGALFIQFNHLPVLQYLFWCLTAPMSLFAEGHCAFYLPVDC